MIEVNIEELKKEKNKYIELAKKEEIRVIKDGQWVLTFVPAANNSSKK